MSWGDPYDKFYKDSVDRVSNLTDRGIVPGAMIIAVSKFDSPTNLPLWEQPDIKSHWVSTKASQGIVIGVDCETDPVQDWIAVMLISGVHGWTLPDYVELI